MSDVRVKQSELRTVLNNMAPFFPQGSKEIPVGFYFKGNSVTIVCLQGIVYQAVLELVDGTDNSYCTILYHNIAPLLESSGLVKLSKTPFSLIVEGSDFSVEFPFGYSDVEEQDVPDSGYKAIVPSMYSNGFKTILNLGLDAMYKLNPPVLIQRDIAVQKFPNVWVQVRTPGLPICTSIDKEHIKLVQRFSPRQVCDTVNGILTFLSDNSVLQIPCRPIDSDISITDILDDMNKVVTLSMGNYFERLKMIAKVGNPHCNVVVKEDGISTEITSGTAQMKLNCGKCEGDVYELVSIPLQLWLAFLKGVETDKFQILVGGGKICLRTQNMIIVTRVLR